MLSVPVYTMKGEPAGEVSIDPEVLGGKVRSKLIKQAIVAYLDHARQDSARTKGKAQVEGSTRKLYRQKGTGNARMGQIRQPVRRGGGRTFAKRIPHTVLQLPKKMRRLARDSAILAKIQANEVMVVDGFHCDEPKTKTFATMLTALSARQGCVFALHAPDSKAYLSARNIPKTEIKVMEELTAYEVLRRRKLIFTKPAFERMAAGNVSKAAASA